jgi:hypothetical protein
VAIIVDFDALNDRSTLERLMKSVSASTEIQEKAQQLRSLVDSDLRGGEARRTKAKFQSDSAELLSDVPLDTVIPSAVASQLEALLKPQGKWSSAKAQGIGVLKGEGRRAANELLELLSGVGLWIVPSGALESWVPEVGSKSSRWLTGVLEGDYIAKAARAGEFVGKVSAQLAAGSTQ